MISIEIILLSVILVAAIILFATGLIRMDLTALLVLFALGVTGLVSPAQALSGFSNSSVVVVWAMYILSAGLVRTGVTNLIGSRLLSLAGKGEGRLIAILMSTTALLSSIMNNIGVAAMFLPVTLEIARRTKRPASRLLLPMAYGALHGGMILLVGTATNLIVQDMLQESGLMPLGIFDFAPGGLVILIVSVGYMVLIGRHYLPDREIPRALSADDSANGEASQDEYALQERLATLIIPEENQLVGKTLIESRIGRVLELTILSIQRQNGQRVRAKTDTLLEGGDRLLVLGRLDRIDELCQSPLFVVDDERPVAESLLFGDVGLGEFTITEESAFAGKSVNEINMRHSHGVNILAIHQGDIVRRTNLQNLVLNPGDRLLIHGSEKNLSAFQAQPGYCNLSLADTFPYLLDERLLTIRIPEGSNLAGQTLAESQLGEAYGLTVLRILRSDEDCHMPEPETPLKEGDRLIVEGRPLDIEVIRGIQSLKIERQADIDMEELTRGPIQIVEVMLSPYSTLAGKTLRQNRFRERFQVSVLAIRRGDRAYRSELGQMTLKHGDALLCYGTVDNLKAMARERDFVVLKMDLQEEPLIKKAPMTAIIMAAVVLAAILFGMPISLAAVGGSALMVLSGALKMDEAYQSIDWRSIFLIAAMLPLGIAIQETGAAAMVSQWLVSSIGRFGPTVLLGGLMVLIIAGKMVMPGAVLAVVVSPIALNVALDLGISPYAYLMGISYALASSFMSPIAHPVNTMVMTPGGYRFGDYVKLGLPVVIIVIVLSLILLPIIFPFY